MKRFISTDFLRTSRVEKIDAQEAINAGISLFVKREDQLHPQLSGNKWRKLKYNLIQAQEEGKKVLLTFGGAYSNHIAAVAEAGTQFNFNTIGIIRGEKPRVLNPTLLEAEKKGMDLVYVSRLAYKNKEIILQDLDLNFSETYIIPEGGTNVLALKGCKEIMDDNTIDYWCVASGTGGTAAGMITGLERHQHLIAFPVLKGKFMKKSIQDLLEKAKEEKTNWSIQEDYHFGGYAKYDARLIEFINTFKEKYNIPLDPVYTGKLVFGVFDLIQKGFFRSGSKVMIVHTGGLQGIEGFNKRFGNIIK